ncbi:MAG: hypothetical protein IPN68_13235 [Bacteroidetes bacterium]|nr:hypothetical protein [Bacteroidota bacterium]
MQVLRKFFFSAILSYYSQKTVHPHGADFKISCSQCHSSSGWTIDKKNYSFDHNTTNLPLTGQHTDVDCKQCHKTLVFSEAKSECIACHNDIHQELLD